MFVQIDACSGAEQKTVGYINRDFVENSEINKIGSLEMCERACSLEGNRVYMQGACVGEIQIISPENNSSTKRARILNSFHQCIGIVTVDNDTDMEDYSDLEEVSFEDDDYENFSLTEIEPNPWEEGFFRILRELSLEWWVNPLLWIKMVIQMQSNLLNQLLESGVQAFFTFFHAPMSSLPEGQLMLISA